MEQLGLALSAPRPIFTVSELNEAVRITLEGAFGHIWVTGEISNARLASSGHYYFVLKDRDAQVRCVCFRQEARYLKVKPQDGLAVTAGGRLSVYGARGEYQLYVESVEPLGYGALQLAFEQLKKKLEAEGLFDEKRKRPLPALPRRIGIVTSPQGAAIADILRILERRFSGLHVMLYPAMVQGEEAPRQIVRGLAHFSSTACVDVVIVGRGGGSLEDLWAFNDEQVARAIAACSVPVISAVGHQTDFTIADFVADLRAPTPSAAAELVVGRKGDLVQSLEALSERALRAIRYRLATCGGACALLKNACATASTRWPLSTFACGWPRPACGWNTSGPVCLHWRSGASNKAAPACSPFSNSSTISAPWPCWSAAIRLSRTRPARSFAMPPIRERARACGYASTAEGFWFVSTRRSRRRNRRRRRNE
jgi:exodeoxyribonuclease VII large subunit